MLTELGCFQTAGVSLLNSGNDNVLAGVTTARELKGTVYFQASGAHAWRVNAHKSVKTRALRQLAELCKVLR